MSRNHANKSESFRKQVGGSAASAENGDNDRAPGPPEVDHLVAALQARYAQHLHDVPESELTDIVGDSVNTGLELRAYSLSNADEPDLIFRAPLGDD